MLHKFAKKYSGLNPSFKFALRGILFLVAWQLLYDLYLHTNSKIDLWLVENLLSSSRAILKRLGFITFVGAQRLMGIDSTSGLWVGDPCNGLTLFAIFTGFIIVFPGKLIHKLWFIPSGIIIIHALNILRIVSLAIIQLKYSKETVEFNHSYTFTILIYSFIFLMWIIWVRYFSNTSYAKK